MLEQNDRTPENLIRSARWLHEEIPIRLAHRLYEFLRLPHVVVCNPFLNKVYETYLKSFEALTNLPPLRTNDDSRVFAETLQRLFNNHSPVLRLMQQGHKDLSLYYSDINIDGFLDKLFVTRIGNRVLTEHFLLLREDQQRPRRVGLVQHDCCPKLIIQHTARSLTSLCNDVYGMCPEIIIEDRYETTFPYIPEHVQFVIQEILKNSLRATIEKHGLPSNGKVLPAISVDINKGEFDVIIKISDRGGGMRQDTKRAIWSYGFTTANVYSDDVEASSLSLMKTEIRGRREIAGYGFGLPLSLLYARYFGGDLHLQTMYGFGSDVYLNLNHLGTGGELHFLEPLAQLKDKSGRD